MFKYRRDNETMSASSPTDLVIILLSSTQDITNTAGPTKTPHTVTSQAQTTPHVTLTTVNKNINPNMPSSSMTISPSMSSSTLSLATATPQSVGDPSANPHQETENAHMNAQSGGVPQSPPTSVKASDVLVVTIFKDASSVLITTTVQPGSTFQTRFNPTSTIIASPSPHDSTAISVYTKSIITTQSEASAGSSSTIFPPLSIPSGPVSSISKRVPPTGIALGVTLGLASFLVATAILFLRWKKKRYRKLVTPTPGKRS